MEPCVHLPSRCHLVRIEGMSARSKQHVKTAAVPEGTCQGNALQQGGGRSKRPQAAIEGEGEPLKPEHLPDGSRTVALGEKRETARSIGRRVPIEERNASEAGGVPCSAACGSPMRAAACRCLALASPQRGRVEEPRGRGRRRAAGAPVVILSPHASTQEEQEAHGPSPMRSAAYQWVRQWAGRAAGAAQVRIEGRSGARGWACAVACGAARGHSAVRLLL